MAQLIIDTGAAANDGTGDPLRTAFTETNNNFTAIFTAGPVDSNVRITDNTILTLNTNGNLVLAPNGMGQVVANVDIVPNSSNIRNLGSTTARWSTVYSQYLDVSNSTTFAGNVTVSGNVTGAYILGDGSQLTNLPAGDYGNANVAAYLPTYTGNLSANNVAVTNDINISGSGDIVMTNGKINTSRIRSIGETGQDLWLEGETVVTIRTDEGGSDYDWTFQIDGSLRWPNGTTQTTAWTGTVPGWQLVESPPPIDFNSGSTQMVQLVNTPATLIANYNELYIRLQGPDSLDYRISTIVPTPDVAPNSTISLGTIPYQNTGDSKIIFDVLGNANVRIQMGVNTGRYGNLVIYGR